MSAREFRGHHTYFGEMPRRHVPGALINGGRIHFGHLPARARGRHWKSRGDGGDGRESG